MSRRTLAIAVAVLLSLAVALLAAFAVLAYVRTDDFAHDESVQRVTTIGERCESQYHQALEHGPQEHWFLKAHRACLGSLAKVEARAGVSYHP